MKAGSLFILFGLLLLSGCTSGKIERKLDDFPIGSVWRPSNVFALEQLPSHITRVAVLPLNSASSDLADTAAIQQLLLNELRQLGRFEIVELTADTVFRLTGSDTIAVPHDFPPALLEFIRNQVGATAVLQHDLTAYRPYRPFVVGMRARLFDASDRSIVWSVDELADAGVDKVHTGARKYAMDHLQEQAPFTDSHAVLRSPRRFTEYVAFTLYQTIPAF